MSYMSEEVFFTFIIAWIILVTFTCFRIIIVFLVFQFSLLFSDRTETLIFEFSFICILSLAFDRDL